jgi:hypothetical protein
MWTIIIMTSINYSFLVVHVASKLYHSLASTGRSDLVSNSSILKPGQTNLPYTSSRVTLPCASHQIVSRLICCTVSPAFAPGGRLSAGPGGGSAVNLKLTTHSMLEKEPGSELPERVRAITLQSVVNWTKFLLMLYQTSRLTLTIPRAEQEQM